MVAGKINVVKRKIMEFTLSYIFGTWSIISAREPAEV
jgi:hypothetical protein